MSEVLSGERRRGEGRRERGGGREVEEIYFGDKVEEGEEEDLERKGRQQFVTCFFRFVLLLLTQQQRHRHRQTRTNSTSAPPPAPIPMIAS